MRHGRRFFLLIRLNQVVGGWVPATLKTAVLCGSGVPNRGPLRIQGSPMRMRSWFRDEEGRGEVKRDEKRIEEVEEGEDVREVLTPKLGLQSCVRT